MVHVPLKKEDTLYHHDQKGTLMMWITLYILVQGICFYAFLDLAMGGLICIIVALFLVVFSHKLTVKVTRESLHLSFGVGLIHRRINVDAIQSVDAVRNRW